MALLRHQKISALPICYSTVIRLPMACCFYFREKYNDYRMYNINLTTKTFVIYLQVIHRDLATRNILITENNVVRICDFGLSQQGVTYAIKTANKLLPLKWLALEVLTTKKFSIFSDMYLKWCSIVNIIVV